MGGGTIWPKHLGSCELGEPIVCAHDQFWAADTQVVLESKAQGRFCALGSSRDSKVHPFKGAASFHLPNAVGVAGS